MILRMRIWWLLFAGCFATSIYYLVNRTPRQDLVIGGAAALLTSLLFTAAAILLVYSIVAPLMLVRLRSRPGVLCEHAFEVSEEGLREVTSVSEIRVAPGNVRRLMRTRSHIIVQVSTRGAFLMPRRDFADGPAYEEFWKGLQPLVAAKKS